MQKCKPAAKCVIACPAWESAWSLSASLRKWNGKSRAKSLSRQKACEAPRNAQRERNELAPNLNERETCSQPLPASAVANCSVNVRDGISDTDEIAPVKGCRRIQCVVNPGINHQTR